MGTNDSSLAVMGLQTQANELIKSHTEFDGSNRPTAIYTAKANAKNGEPCTVVFYDYLGTTSLVSGMREENSTWDGTWDF